MRISAMQVLVLYALIYSGDMNGARVYKTNTS